MQALHKAFDQCVSPGVVLSLSGGFDSRVLLSRLLYHGARPVVGTMGFPSSTDRIVATLIAKAFNLEHRVVELQVSDYLLFAKEIVRLTGGTKTANHWHTYIYTRRVGFDRHRLDWLNGPVNLLELPGMIEILWHSLWICCHSISQPKSYVIVVLWVHTLSGIRKACVSAGSWSMATIASPMSQI